MSSDSGKSGRERVILHCDMNGFYAAVELLQRPDLKDRPMAVSGDPDSRHGIILAKNNLAKAAGVPCETVVAQSTKPHEEIVRAANQYQCDCIFMASNGRKGLNKLFIGSETQKVLTTADVPVLVYR